MPTAQTLISSAFLAHIWSLLPLSSFAVVIGSDRPSRLSSIPPFSCQPISLHLLINEQAQYNLDSGNAVGDRINMGIYLELKAAP